MGFNLEARKATIYDSGDKPFATSTRDFVATALFNLLSDDSAIEEAKNQYIHVSGIPSVAQNDILKVLRKYDPGQWSVELVNSLEILKQAHDDVRNQDFWGIGKMVQVYTFSDDLGIGSFDDTKVWNTRLGLEEQNLEAVIRGVLEGDFKIIHFPPHKIPTTLLPEVVAAA